MTWILLSIAFTTLCFFGCALFLAMHARTLGKVWTRRILVGSLGFVLMGIGRAISLSIVRDGAVWLPEIPQVRLHVQSVLTAVGAFLVLLLLWHMVQTIRRWREMNPFQVEDLRASLERAFQDLEDSEDSEDS